jgi:tetraacyldisaccharide 4'-kinase
LAEKSLKCVILTRGYLAGQEKLTDEPAILTKCCPASKIVVNPDRVAAAKALRDSDVDVIILDDGFQHRRLRRDIDIITIDATCPFGYGRMLPAGLLREPPQAIERADAVVITRCERLSQESQKLLEERIRKISPDIVTAKAIHKNCTPRTIKDRIVDIDHIKGKNAFAFCGIGNPDAFLANIGEIGIELVGWRIFNDHHNYSEQDIKDIYEKAGSLKTDIILTTRKDWVKIALLAEKYSDIIWAYLPVKLEFLEGYDRIAVLIGKTIAKSNV